MPCTARLRGKLAVELLEDRVNPVSFTAGYSTVVESSANSIAFGDVNGDGAADLAVGTAQSGIEIFSNDGSGNFSRTATVAGIDFPTGIQLADLNGDGFADVVAGGGQRVAIALSNGDGTFCGPIIQEVGAYVQGVYPADFNGDGKLDVVAAIPGGAAVLFNTGAADILGDATLYNHLDSAGAARIAVGDLNGDSMPDFVVSVQCLQRVEVYLNNGTGNFTRTQYDNPIRNDSGDVVIGDFTNDGRPDILVQYGQTGMLGLMCGDGDGTFQTAAIINASTSQLGPIVAADFDHDGNLDILTTQGSTEDEIVLPGKGDGMFAAAVPTGAANSTALAIADVNGDGLPDIGSSQGPDAGTVTVSTNTTPVDLYFVVTAQSHATAGEPISLTITARGPAGSILTDYTGTIHIACTDCQADLPNQYEFTPADQGVKTITVTLKSAGERTLTITDPARASAFGQSTVVVDAAAAASFDVNAPGTVIAGKSFSVTISVRDQFGNLVDEYVGPVHLTSSEPDAALPADPTLYNGAATIPVAFAAEGDWTITATNTNSGLIATSPVITANPPPMAPVVVDFGVRGLRRWTESEGWVKLSRLNAEQVAASADTAVVVADFGAFGLRRWTETGGWVTLSHANVRKVAVSSNGSTIVADFGVHGLRRWTETGAWEKISKGRVQQFFVSGDGSTVVADRGHNRLQRWVDGVGWALLTPANPGKMAVSADGHSIVANFINGTWYWSQTGGWTYLASQVARQLAVSGDGSTAVIDLGGTGLWTWSKAAGAEQIQTLNAQDLSVSFDGQTVVADFGLNGLKSWTRDRGWRDLSTANVQGAFISPDGDSVVADFGLHGLRHYGLRWSMLSGLNAEQIVLG